MLHKVDVSVQSVDEMLTIKCSQTKAVLSCGAVYYAAQCGCNIITSESVALK